MQRWIARCCLVIALTIAAPLHAAKPPGENAADTKAAFAEQAALVRQQMAPGGRYAFVTPDDRAKVDARLDEMIAIFDAGDVATLPRERLADLYVAQEEINAILTGRDERRVICERTRVTGSHMKTPQCVPFAKKGGGWRASREAIRDAMRPAYFHRSYNDGR